MIFLAFERAIWLLQSPRLSPPSTRPIPSRNAISCNRIFFGPALQCREFGFRTCFSGNPRGDHFLESFSDLPSATPWNTRDIWWIFASYIFTLHIPLSFGGVEIVAYLLHQSTLDSFTMVTTVIVFQAVESVAAVAFLDASAKPGQPISRFFSVTFFGRGRNWMKASTCGSFVLFAVVFSYSFLAERIFGPNDASDPILMEILSYGPASIAECIFLYCLTTPLLEETIYRGFLLTSLSTRMKWWQAVVVSAAAFSAVHFSWENFPLLFIVGVVLGAVYCWTGTLAASFAVHSAYNALIISWTLYSS